MVVRFARVLAIICLTQVGRTWDVTEGFICYMDTCDCLVGNKKTTCKENQGCFADKSSGANKGNPVCLDLMTAGPCDKESGCPCGKGKPNELSISPITLVCGAGEVCGLDGKTLACLPPRMKNFEQCTKKPCLCMSSKTASNALTTNKADCDVGTFCYNVPETPLCITAMVAPDGADTCKKTPCLCSGLTAPQVESLQFELKIVVEAGEHCIPFTARFDPKSRSIAAAQLCTLGEPSPAKTCACIDPQSQIPDAEVCKKTQICYRRVGTQGAMSNMRCRGQDERVLSQLSGAEVTKIRV